MEKGALRVVIGKENKKKNPWLIFKQRYMHAHNFIHYSITTPKFKILMYSLIQNTSMH